ncbi:cell wall-binding repeat-containing protein [Pedococcus soli]
MNHVVLQRIKSGVGALVCVTMAIGGLVLSGGSAAALTSPLELKIEQLTPSGFAAGDTIQLRFTATNKTGKTLSFTPDNGLSVTFDHHWTQDPQGSWSGPCHPDGWGDPNSNYSEDDVSASLPATMANGDVVTCTLTYSATAADVSNHGVYGTFRYTPNLNDWQLTQAYPFWWFTYPAAGYADTPAITGKPSVGQTLGVAFGYWGAWDQKYKFQWMRNGVAIAGATSSTYRLVAQDAGKTISAALKGFDSFGGSIPKTAGPTSPVVNPVERWAGADRFSTAAAVSSHAFAPHVPVAFVASGVTFPDALAGAPVAVIKEGPVLLTSRDQLPSAVRRELARLQPAKIVILGGAGSVSAAVQTALAAYSPTVTRWQGANRYQTSAQIAKQAFPTASCVYLSSGLSFPDALSAAPVAGMRGCPMLLADSALDPSVRAEIVRLKPKQIYLVGGTAVLPDTVRNAALAAAPGATALRISGSDRYSTSSAVSKQAFPASALPLPGLFVASGTSFPDALGAAAVAGIRHVPLLLTTPSALPGTVTQEIERLQAAHAVVVAGTAAVSNTVVTGIAAHLP